MRIIRVLSEQYRFSIVIYQIHNESDIWLKTINVSKIVIKTSILNEAKYKKSFLDRMSPDEMTLLRTVGVIIAESIVEVIRRLY